MPNPGMVTGSFPGIGISPSNAFTAASSPVVAVLNVARYAATFGNGVTKYGFPSDTKTTGTGPSVSLRTNGARSPLSIGLVVKVANTIAEHVEGSPNTASSATGGSKLSTNTTRAC